jgi:hypothetical protein
MRVWFPVVSLVVVALSSEARASEGLSLSWMAPAACPTASEVEVEIERGLARLEADHRVEVDATVRAAEEPEGGFTLQVLVRHDSESSERTLLVSECAEVARATALFVALAVQSEPEELASDSAPAPSPPLASNAQQPPASPEPGPSRLAILREPRWAVSLGPQAAVGFGPSTDLGVDIGVGIALTFERDFWRVVVRGGSFLPAESTVSGTRSGGDFSMLSGAALGCLGPGFSSVALFGCLGGKLYYLSAEGFGTDADQSRSTTIAAASAALELEWRLTRSFFLLTGAEAGYAPETARFVIDNVGLVHETGQIFGEGRIELGASF